MQVSNVNKLLEKAESTLDLALGNNAPQAEALAHIAREYRKLAECMIIPRRAS